MATATPVAAQSADQARAEAYGAQISGTIDLGPLPEPVAAEVPPGESDSDSFLEVPAEPAAFSGTLSGDVEAARDATLTASLQSVADGASTAALPQAWNSRGHAITEELGVLFADGGGDLLDNPDLLGDAGGATVQQADGALLTAEVVEAEALATCDGGAPSFATASRVQNLELGGDPLPLLDDVLDTAVELVIQGEPNEDVLANLPAVGDTLADLGLEVVAWDTNWDGADGTTDGSDTVWANALRVSVTEGSTLGDLVGAQDIVVSHAEASVDCDDEPVDPAENPLRDVTKEASQDVVAPGDTFTYTITVPNADPDCTLENVEVVDTITGPAGSQVVGTSPEADDVADLTVTWSDVGPIPPGEEVALTVDVAVPDDAAGGEVYREDVAVSGECDGVPVDGDVTFEGPEVAFDKGAGPAQPDTEPAGQRLPETGATAPAAVGLAFMLAGGIAAVLGRRSAA